VWGKPRIRCEDTIKMWMCLGGSKGYGQDACAQVTEHLRAPLNAIMKSRVPQKTPGGGAAQRLLASRVMLRCLG
jgi:hypothetical protein